MRTGPSGWLASQRMASAYGGPTRASAYQKQDAAQVLPLTSQPPPGLAGEVLGRRRVTHVLVERHALGGPLGCYHALRPIHRPPHFVRASSTSLSAVREI